MNCGLDEVMELCCEVSSSRKIRAAVRGSARGAVVAGIGAFLGGLLGGPLGIAFGGTVGALVGMSRSQFKPFPEIIMKLPLSHKEKLYSGVMAALGTLDWVDVAKLTVLVLGNVSLQEQVFNAILHFATKELKAKVQYEK